MNESMIFDVNKKLVLFANLFQNNIEIKYKIFHFRLFKKNRL